MLSERARLIWVSSQEEARDRNHPYICSGHILLGLLRDTESIAAKILTGYGISLEKIRADVEAQLKPVSANETIIKEEANQND